MIFFFHSKASCIHADPVTLPTSHKAQRTLPTQLHASYVHPPLNKLTFDSFQEIINALHFFPKGSELGEEQCTSKIHKLSMDIH